MSQDTVEQEKIRLLRDDDTLTLEEIPWFDGPPEYDTALQVALERHRFPNGEPHRGRLIVVEKRAWDMPNLRKALIDQIWEGRSKGLAEFDSSFYEVKDQFKEDAMTCFRQHGSPKEGCPDFRTEGKRLLPDTKADRKEAGLSSRGMPVIHLCDFCPVRQYYARKYNEEKGIG